MQTLLLVAELMIAVALVVFVLLQRSEGGGLGIGGGGGNMGGLFSPRGAADTLTRTTAILAVLFFVTCIGLDLLAGRPVATSTDSLLGGPGIAAPVQRPAPPPAPAPAGPQVPKPQ